MARAALFDMDRTLLRVETASLYVRYKRDIGEASWRDAMRVAWWVAQYTLGVVDAPEVAGRALRTIAGTDEALFTSRCEDWFRRYVERHVAEAGRRAVEAHKARGDVVAIVTGASSYTARPLARRLGIEHLVASELEVGPDGRFTGRPIDPLCYGRGKVVRTARLAQALGFSLDEAVFYSDSHTDLPLLERVREPIAVNPDMRLARVAKKRGWRVERW
jgi:HAD superfamily hydrolase (TIGR01490 family)